MSRTVKKWSLEEDEILLQQVNRLSNQGKPKDWTAIASVIPGRSNKDCRKRWCNHLVGGLRKGPWDPNEDRRLAIGVDEHGLQWSLVAEEVGTRSADQCAKRWHHSLDPSLDRSKWTKAEEKKLLEAVEKYGRAWKHIQTSYFPGRAANNVKNRYVTLTRKGDPPNESNKTQETPSANGESDGDNSDDTSSECSSPGQVTSSTSRSDQPTSNYSQSDDAMMDNYNGQQMDDPFSFGVSAGHGIPSMSMGMTTPNLSAMDMNFDLGDIRYTSGADEHLTSSDTNNSMLTSDHGFHDSSVLHSETYANSCFNPRMDSRVIPFDMGLLQENRAELVLTIENPTQQTVTDIMEVLVPSKTRFRMEMK